MPNPFENFKGESNQEESEQLYHCSGCGKIFKLKSVPRCCLYCGQKFGSFKQESTPVSGIEFDDKGRPIKTKTVKTIEQKRAEEFRALPEKVRNAYAIIGKRKWELDQDSNPLETIKQQWRDKAKIFHPDTNKGDNESMKQINTARDILNDIYKQK